MSESQTDAVTAAPVASPMRWYVVHAYSGMEKAVERNLRERIEVMTEDGPRMAYVVATNVYHKTPQGWRMVAHHASPATDQDAQEITQTLHTLH